MANVAVAKAYARRINHGDITLEKIKVKVFSNMYEEIMRQFEALQTV